MKEKLNRRIEMIRYELGDKRVRQEELIRDMKEAVAKSDVYSIITFVPGYIRDIEALDREIKNLEEQRRMLMWIAKEEDNA